MASHKRFTFEDLTALAKGCLKFPVKPCQRTLGWWEEEDLDTSIGGRVFPKIWKSSAIQKNLLLKFWNFYFNGDIPKNQSVDSIVLPVITLARKKDSNGTEFIFQDDFWENNESQNNLFNVGLQIENLSTIKPIKQNSDIAWSSTPSQRLFHGNIYRLIADWKEENDIPPNIVKLCNLTSFVAMTLFRAICKNASYLTREFRGESYLPHINDVAGWPSNFHYAPPCKDCISQSHSIFNTKTRQHEIMFAIILKSWKISQFEPAAFLDKAILSATKYNGLILFDLLDSVSKMFKLTVDEVASVTNINNCDTSWECIREFQEKYPKDDPAICTHPWARIIDDGYFTDYMIKWHCRLAGVFAGILSHDPTHRDIQKSTWIQKNPTFSLPYFTVGRDDIYHQISALSIKSKCISPFEKLEI